MIRLFASDMDGTLLSSSGTISRYTADSIRRLQTCGIEFIVNTGREYNGAKKELDAAGISCDMICCSGACTYDRYGNPSNIASLPKSTAKKILELFKKHGAYADIYTEQGKTSIEDRECFLSYYHNEVFPSLKEENKVYYQTPGDFHKMASQVKFFESADSLLGTPIPIYKISTTFSDPEKISSLRKEVEAIEGLHIASTSSTNDPSEILAIGDSENDYSMLSLNLGSTVAMANAEPSIKRICRAETLSNDEDGVAVLMEGRVTERCFYEINRRYVFGL